MFLSGTPFIPIDPPGTTIQCHHYFFDGKFQKYPLLSLRSAAGYFLPKKMFPIPSVSGVWWTPSSCSENRAYEPCLCLQARSPTECAPWTCKKGRKQSPCNRHAQASGRYGSCTCMKLIFRGIIFLLVKYFLPGTTSETRKGI